MKLNTKKTPIRYYGGKQTMLRHILPVIPQHNNYVEPFFGGGAVFFAKEPSPFEVINDTNNELINFYKVLKNDFKALNQQVQDTLHSRKLYAKASFVYNSPELFDDITRAWAVWVLSTQGFAGQLDSSWGYSKISRSKHAKRINNDKRKFTEYLTERMEGVQIDCIDAIEVITKYDADDSFHYVDPPYYNADMGHYGGYTEADFTKLLDSLAAAKGKFLLSSYPSDLLEEYTAKHGWQTIKVNKPVAVSTKATKNKTEVLTANYALNQ